MIPRPRFAVHAFVWGTATVIAAFIILPLAVIVPMSFSSSDLLNYPIPGFSLQWYDAVLQPYPWMFAFGNSVIVGGITTAVSTVFGTLAAYGLTSREFRYKTAVIAFITSPMIVPTVITALALYFATARTGLLGSYTAIVLGHTVIAVPFVVITVTASFAGFDRNIARAAVSLGATPLHAFLTTTLPMTLPGILCGAIFAFLTSFDDVVIALFLASPSTQTLPRHLFGGLRGDSDPTILAVAVLLIGISLLFYVVVQFLHRRVVTMSRRAG